LWFARATARRPKFLALFLCLESRFARVRSSARLSSMCDERFSVTEFQSPITNSTVTMTVTSRSRRRSDVPADRIPFKGLQLARVWFDG
jgi:hypothetical protein